MRALVPRLCALEGILACFGPTTPERARRLVDASVDQTEARKLPATAERDEPFPAR